MATMTRKESTALRIATGFNASDWSRRLRSLYNEAKRRNGGHSLTIYGEVSDMQDVLEGLDEIPNDRDLAIELNELAGRLRRE